ncbi:hypothetical protein [Paenibacillus polymyxa]|uniref:hypothetical protein n=1 Tax=Paenibacillus polymyxa TaxID=1406 RepID=UPI0003D2BA42|nr:hypothetical protein [Paenibacillus polymyxa]AHC22703.1 hypothetical protein X809_06445 [Paenibacillus polymyxa CR1]
MSESMKSDALSNAEVLDILKEKIGFVGKPSSSVEWRYELNKTGKLVIDGRATLYDIEQAMQITIDLARAFFIPSEPIVDFKVVVGKHEWPRIESTTLPISPAGWANIKAGLTY